MLLNNIRNAFRQLIKNKIFSSINLIGLALGVAACLFILQYVVFELSYDRFHQDIDRIYRVANDRFQNGQLIQHGTITYPTIGPALKEDYQEVETATRIEPRGNSILRVNEETFKVNSFINADEHFLEVFSYPMLAGDRKNCLKDPWTVVLTRDLAEKYYNAKNDYSVALGNMIIIGTDATPYKITGVIDNVPENSHLHFELLASYASIIQAWGKQVDDSWTWSNMWHYVKLKPGVDYKALQSKFGDFSQRHFKGNQVSGSEETFFLQPLKDAHLYSDFEYEIGDTGDADVVWGSLIIAVLVLIIAWVNYINLSTARAIERAKEVGIRKTLGAYKRQLVQQFLSESALFNLLGIALALLIVQLLQPSFNQMLNMKLSLNALFKNDLGGPMVLLMLGVGLLAGVFLSGLYPAFILSAYQPIKVLKGKLGATRQGAWLRQALVVFQFTAAIVFITATFAIYRQIRFMSQRDLGFNMHQTLCVSGPELTKWDSTYIERTNSFVNDVENLPRIQNATTSARLPSHRLGRLFDVKLVGDTVDHHFTTSELGIGNKFIENFGISILAGRSFNLSDYHVKWEEIHNTVINQSTLRLVGLQKPEDAIGRKLRFNDQDWDIVGVIGDFHQQSLKVPMEAIIFLPYHSNDEFFSIKVEKGSLAETVAGIREKYLAYFPGNSFEYFFLDEYFNRQYSNEQLFGKVAGTFTLLAIIVACLGLFGLVLFNALQRRKEVGIRKVLGASVQNLILMMSKNFIKLILIAFVIGLPLSYLSIDSWLSNYPYSINVDWMMFALPCVALLMVAVLIMSLQTMKAASSNPVDSLRNE